MSTADIKEFIRKVELFNNLTDEELNVVAEKMKIESYEKESILFSENNPHEVLFIIYEGEVELFKRTPFGQEKRLAFFSKYDFLGEGSLVDDSPHSTSARTLLNTKVIIIDKFELTNLSNKHGEIAVKLYSTISRVISRRMKRTNINAVNIGD